MKIFSVLAVLTSLLVISCQKELSYETNKNLSDGSLQDDGTGICLGNTVSGSYMVDTLLKAANYVDVNVNVLAPGTYTIYTDTVNGYYFRATGNFTTAGATTVRLQGVGTPAVAGSDIFSVFYDSTQCFFSVNVTAAGTGGGGGGSAEYTFDGAPGACTNADVQGTYTVGSSLNATNIVVINVNVTVEGTYTISTPIVNGMSFNGTGSFTGTGPQTVTLSGFGLPATAGVFTFTLTVGTTTCSFQVTCAGTSAPGDYFPRTASSNWSYEWSDVSTDSLQIRVIPQTLSALGNTYAIFMQTDNAVAGYDSSGYYRKAGNDYYQWVDMGDLWGLNDPIWVEYIFLKDNLTAGDSWNTPGYTGNFTDPTSGTTFPVTVRFAYSILQQDVVHSLATSTGTANFANTIVVEERYEQFDGTDWQDLGFGTTRYFYARDIGLIDIQYYDENDVILDKLEMRRYVVN